MTITALTALFAFLESCVVSGSSLKGTFENKLNGSLEFFFASTDPELGLTLLSLSCHVEEPGLSLSFFFPRQGIFSVVRKQPSSVVRIFGSFYVPGKLPTYSSPKPTFFPK